MVANLLQLRLFLHFIVRIVRILGMCPLADGPRTHSGFLRTVSSTPKQSRAASADNADDADDEIPLCSWLDSSSGCPRRDALLDKRIEGDRAPGQASVWI